MNDNMEPRRKTQQYFFILIIFLSFELSKQQPCSKEYIYKISGSSSYYSSCIKIPNYQYIYEKDSSTTYCNSCCTCYTSTSSYVCGWSYFYCYNSRPSDCKYYYPKIDGVRKCASIDECIIKGFNYIIENDGVCRDNCENCYKIEKVSIGNRKYLKCFNTLEKALDDSEVNYCDITARQCWTHFPDDGTYFIKSQIYSTSTKLDVSINVV